MFERERTDMIKIELRGLFVLSSFTVACGASSLPPPAQATSEPRCAIERVAQSGAAESSDGTELPAPRYGAAAVSYQGALYLVGGSAPRGFVGTVERFDPEAATWTTVTDRLVPRRFLTAVVHE